LPCIAKSPVCGWAHLHAQTTGPEMAEFLGKPPPRRKCLAR